MIGNLYAKYLLADRLNKLAESAGVRVDIITIHDPSKYSTVYKDVHLQCSLPDDRSDKGNEEAAVRLLDVLPENLSAALRRQNGLIFIEGRTNLGLAFQFYTGTGVCERVQTGTRTVQRPDPEYLAAAPLIEVVEPVFEARCPEPEGVAS